MPKLVVMKFGGTSIGSAGRIASVAAIVSGARKKISPVVVVSAMSTVTDLLVDAAEQAANKHRTKLESDLNQLKSLHFKAVSELSLTNHETTRLNAVINNLLTEVTGLLESIFILGELTPRARDKVSSFGERLSIQLVAGALKNIRLKAQPVEATAFIVTTDDFGDARPILEKSSAKSKKIINKLLANGTVPVVTGFIGATTGGITTTFGRGGSDYSATILGNCLDAHEVWIFTDVDGAMSADPRIIPEAKTIPTLSYSEAAELSYFGAKVLHPLTMVPASLKNIPIRVKNTFSPGEPGTRITRHNSARNGCKAISSINRLSLITVQGKGMTGVPGIAAKVFTAIAAAGVNVLFISQASSEYNISLIVRHEDGANAARVLREVFELELERRNIETVTLEENLAMLAVVGQGMKGHPGAAGKTFSALGDAGVNIMAIAQGSSELNISLVIAQADVPVAVQCIHDAFNLAGDRKAAP